jgi:hypothetical protein
MRGEGIRQIDASKQSLNLNLPAQPKNEIEKCKRIIKHHNTLE